MPEKPLKILILTSSTGGGHDRRAYAFKEWLYRLYGKDVNVHVEHLLENSSAITHFGVWIYNTIQKKAPFLHNVYWYIAEHFIDAQKEKVIMGRHYYHELIKEHQPQLIFSVHDCLNRGYFEDARRLLGKNRVYCATYCGEWSGGKGYSKNWVNPSSDFFIGRNTMALNYAQELGIPASKCSEFCNFLPPEDFLARDMDFNREEYLGEQLGFDPNKFTLFLSTGKFGANNHLSFLKRIQKHCERFQVIVVCGNNRNIYESLIDWQEENPHLSISIEGYSRQIRNYLRASDAIVTRGGANSAAESLFFGCPSIFNGRGGVMPQEQLTVDFFLKHNAGALIKNSRDLESVILEWSDPQSNTYREIKNNLISLQKADHPKDMIESILAKAKSHCNL